jgi:hypothetical protein
MIAQLCISLGFLCSRLPFPTFDQMVSCLIQADSTVQVIFDGMNNCLASYQNCLHRDISPGSRGERSLFLLGTLLESNLAVVEYDRSRIFQEACSHLRGELGISVVSLFLTKKSTGVKAPLEGSMSIFFAPRHSCLVLMKYLHLAYPESISILGSERRSLLHAATSDKTSNVTDIKNKVQYLCDQCPALINLKDDDGNTALHNILINGDKFSFRIKVKIVTVLCWKDLILLIEF